MTVAELKLETQFKAIGCPWKTYTLKKLGRGSAVVESSTGGTKTITKGEASFDVAVAARTVTISLGTEVEVLS